MAKQIRRVIHVNFDPSQQHQEQQQQGGGVLENPVAFCIPDMKSQQGGVRPLAMYATAPTASDLAEGSRAEPVAVSTSPPPRNLGGGTPAASLNCFQVDRSEKGPVQVYLESKSPREDQAPVRSALAAPYYVLNQDSKPFSLEVTPPTEPGRPGHVVGHPSPSSTCRPNLLFESSRGKTDEVKSVVSRRETPRSRGQPPPPTARSPPPSGGPQSAGGSYTFGDSLGPNCRLLTSKGMVKGCLCGEENLMGDEEFYPIDYKKEPGVAPLITWKKKKTDKYGTLLVQRGKSNMVVKIPIHDQHAGQLKTDSSTFYNFCMVVILLMGAMWAYVY